MTRTRLMLAALILGGCSSDTGSVRFTDAVTAAGMATLIDEVSGLEWINDEDACNPLGSPSEDTPMRARDFCDGLVFAGHDDWRMPSVEEASALITDAIDDGFELTYQNPGCPAVVAMGGAYIMTHNGSMPGAMTTMPPSVGIRCVR
ncbi:MAG: hypothetical protein AAF411_24250 [Myxococcota bacterium]